jgi:predicted dehydrogenase
MHRRLTIGVIGLGHLGAHHARLAAASATWSLTAVYDIDPARNTALASQYDLSPCESVDELIERCEAVVICTPTASHTDLALRAMGNGRHVLVEKPLCADEAELSALLTTTHRAGVVGAVGHIERFNPAFVAARPHLQSPRFIEAHRLNQFSPRGLATDVVLELMIHDIDLVCDLVGGAPVEIRAAGVPVLSDTDDIANCRLAFADGCVANLTASRISVSPMRKIRIFSVDQYTALDLSEKTAESYRLQRGTGGPPPPGWQPVAQWQERAILHCSFAVADTNALAVELADFHSAIVEGRPPRTDFAAAAVSVRVALQVAAACRDAARRAAAPTR